MYYDDETVCRNEDCVNPRVRTISPAGLGLGLYPPTLTSSSSSVSTSSAGPLAGLNAAASELARLGDRAAAAAAAATAAASVMAPPGLVPWSLPPFTAAADVDTPTDRLGRLDRAAADDRNENSDEYVNKQRSVLQLCNTYSSMQHATFRTV